MSTMTLTLHIAVELNGRPFTIAQIAERDFIVAAARKALDEAQNRAADFATQNPTLGKLQADEANRLQRAFKLLIPELRDIAAPAVM